MSSSAYHDDDDDRDHERKAAESLRRRIRAVLALDEARLRQRMDRIEALYADVVAGGRFTLAAADRMDGLLGKAHLRREDLEALLGKSDLGLLDAFRQLRWDTDAIAEHGHFTLGAAKSWRMLTALLFFSD